MSFLSLSLDLECLKHFSVIKSQLTDKESISTAIFKYNDTIASSKRVNMFVEVIFQSIQGNPTPMSDLIRKLQTAHDIYASLLKNGSCHFNLSSPHSVGDTKVPFVNWIPEQVNDKYFRGGREAGYEMNISSKTDEQEEEEEQIFIVIHNYQYLNYFKAIVKELHQSYSMLVSDMVEAVKKHRTPSMVAHELADMGQETCCEENE